MLSRIKAGNIPMLGSRSSATASLEIMVQDAESRGIILLHAHVAYQGTFLQFLKASQIVVIDSPFQTLHPELFPREWRRAV